MTNDGTVAHEEMISMSLSCIPLLWPDPKSGCLHIIMTNHGPVVLEKCFLMIFPRCIPLYNLDPLLGPHPTPGDNELNNSESMLIKETFMCVKFQRFWHYFLIISPFDPSFE